MNLDRLFLFKKYFKWLKGESLEQAKFVQWLDENNYKFTSIPNSTWTKSIKTVLMNKILGLNPGFPDLVIVLKRKAILLVEMKKEKGKKGGLNGSTISPEQIDWIDTLNDVENVSACIAHGHREAIEKVEEFEQM